MNSKLSQSWLVWALIWNFSGGITSMRYFTVIITAVSFIFGAETIASSAVIAIQAFSPVATPILSCFTSKLWVIETKLSSEFMDTCKIWTIVRTCQRILQRYHDGWKPLTVTRYLNQVHFWAERFLNNQQSVRKDNWIPPHLVPSSFLQQKCAKCLVSLYKTRSTSNTRKSLQNYVAQSFQNYYFADTKQVINNLNKVLGLFTSNKDRWINMLASAIAFVLIEAFNYYGLYFIVHLHLQRSDRRIHTDPYAMPPISVKTFTDQ